MVSSTIKNYAKMGLGFMGGALAAQIVFMIIGIIFFLIGMSMLAGARKNKRSPIPAYVVMGLGVVLGFGIGAGLFFENISKNMNL